jgi:hypothetical protein
MKSVISALLLCLLVANAAKADNADSPEVAACKATGILALKEKSPAVRNMILDMDTAIIAKADTEIEGIAVRTVVMGDVYLEKKGTEKAQHFLCLIRQGQGASHFLCRAIVLEYRFRSSIWRAVNSLAQF